MDHVENGHGFSERYGCLQINVRLLGNSAQILNVVDDILDPPVWKHPLRLRPEHNLASPAPTASAPSVTGILQAWCVDGKESTHVDQTHSFFHWTSEALLFGWSSLCTMHVTLEGVRVNIYMHLHTNIYIYTHIYLQYMHMCVQYLSMYTVYVYSMSVRAYVLELSHCGGFNIPRHIQKVGCCKYHHFWFTWSWKIPCTWIIW